jgi:hypothetical protein
LDLRISGTASNSTWHNTATILVALARNNARNWP